MNIESNPSVATSGRTRRTVVSVAIAVIATIPIAAGTAGASDEPRSADTTVSTVPTTDSPSEETADTLEPTTGSYTDVDVRLTFTLPEGWENNGWSVNTPTFAPGGAGVVFGHVANIFTDPCQWVEIDPPPGPTVDDLASAYADVPVLNPTEPTDVTVDGFHGKQIEFTVPDYNEDECIDGRFGLFQVPGFAGQGPNYWAQAPQQFLRVWILDIDGTRYVIAGNTLAGDLPARPRRPRHAPQLHTD